MLIHITLRFLMVLNSVLVKTANSYDRGSGSRQREKDPVRSGVTGICVDGSREYGSWLMDESSKVKAQS